MPSSCRYRLKNGLLLEPIAEGQTLNFLIEVKQLRKLYEKLIKGAGYIQLILYTHFYGSADNYAAYITLEDLKKAGIASVKDPVKGDFGLLKIIDEIHMALEDCEYTRLNAEYKSDLEAVRSV